MSRLVISLQHDGREIDGMWRWDIRWEIHLDGVRYVRIAPIVGMKDGIRLAALCAQEISARHNIPTIDVQAPPDLAERFRAIAKTRSLHLMTGATK